MKLTIWQNDKLKYYKLINASDKGFILAIWLICKDITSNTNTLPLVVTRAQLQAGNTILDIQKYLSLNEQYSVTQINYFDTSDLQSNYGVFIYAQELLYYLYTFNNTQEMTEYVQLCTLFHVNPRKYLYGPVFDKNRQLFHVGEYDSMYQGFAFWPRLENSIQYDKDGNFIEILAPTLPVLYPITEEEQEKFSDDYYANSLDTRQLNLYSNRFNYSNLWSEYPDNYADYPQYDHDDTYENPFENFIDGDRTLI